MVSGNQAVAYGALEAGIAVAAGYPGTPSTEALAEIQAYARRNHSAPYVEWSTNEKVAFEIAAGAAWAGKRALATMKMSGANVALDSILSVAYSGTVGGLVLYVADDPGAEAGMPEQDSRYFALLAGLPMLEPSSPESAYRLTKFAFQLSEETELPVILRTVTSVAHAQEAVAAEGTYRPPARKAHFTRDIQRFTKAGAEICLAQHEVLLKRLRRAEAIIHEQGINRLRAAPESGQKGLLVISAGVLNRYLEEALHQGPAAEALLLEAIYPLDRRRVTAALAKAKRVLVLEELEPVLELQIRSLATQLSWTGQIIGKLDGVLPRLGRYSVREIARGLEAAARGPGGGEDRIAGTAAAENPQPGFSPFQHPITFCAGCPHRGSYLALNRALKKLKIDREQTVITGDIGCTILGMNPPLEACWTEVSMGSSIGLAQGLARGGIPGPVIATIGDSTFFHAGIPPLVNAVQHGSDLLVMILDNGWTSMTGFQPSPATRPEHLGSNQPNPVNSQRRIEIERIVQALGVDLVRIIDPFNQEEAVQILCQAIQRSGVRVIIARRECALTVLRREGGSGPLSIDADKCTFCRACLRESGCPALTVSPADRRKRVMTIDAGLCTGCGLCATSCSFDAIQPME